MAERTTLRVLIVEDDAKYAAMLAAGLRRWGVVVDVVASMMEAIDAINHVPYSLVVLDADTPDSDKWQTRWSILPEASCPIYVMLDNYDEDTAKDVSRRGASDVLAKNEYRVFEISRAVRECLIQGDIGPGKVARRVEIHRRMKEG